MANWRAKKKDKTENGDYVLLLRVIYDTFSFKLDQNGLQIAGRPERKRGIDDTQI